LCGYLLRLLLDCCFQCQDDIRRGITNSRQHQRIRDLMLDGQWRTLRQIEDITGGSTQSLTVSLDAGNYVFICNLPGHYEQGMHAAFTVS